MKVYLAGQHPQGDVNSWQYQLTIGKCDHVVAGHWMPSKKAILGNYDYAGPFIPVECVESPDLPGIRYEEYELRFAALRSSDLVFSWMPDLMAFWELGAARGAGVKTAVAGPREHWDRMGIHAIGVDYKIPSTAPPMALIEAVKSVQASGHFFNGVWRKMTGKFGSACLLCGDQTEIGEDIMWRKQSEEARGGEVCHLECFVLNAPHSKMDHELQAVGMGLLRKRVMQLEEENERLIETIHDLV